MVKPTVTRTTNPLPFGDLEPKRFEDLVRALAYDFRRWRSLEATGRSGADRGYDARGFEAVEEAFPAEDGGGDDERQAAGTDRLWLVQCKREKSITPERARKHLADVSIDGDDVYGMIFAAACDFSLATRDEVRSWARGKGMSEVHVWGKGELEDQLRQPKNDHLLFTFFGISMQIRKRSAHSELRSILATKRKCVRLLKDCTHQFVLVRDPTDKRYPVLPGAEEELAQGDVKWMVLRFSKIIHRGLVFTLKEHFAYLADDKEGWDVIDTENLAAPSGWDNYWHVEGEGKGWSGGDPSRKWNALAGPNKATYHLERLIPFEAIIDIDEHGDQFAKFPHIYIEGMTGSRTQDYLTQGSTYDLRNYPCSPEKKVDFFSKQVVPDEPPEDVNARPRIQE